MSGDWWRAPRVDPDVAREAVEVAAAETRDLRTALIVSLEVLKMLSMSRPDRMTDIFAERRILGWMLSGQCSIAWLEDIRPAYDFTGSPRRWLATMAMELIETADPRIPPERSVVGVMLGMEAEPFASEIESEMWRLPYVTEAPVRALDLVVTLGRKWSVIDDAYAGAE